MKQLIFKISILLLSGTVFSGEEALPVYLAPKHVTLFPTETVSFDGTENPYLQTMLAYLGCLS